MAGYRTIDDIKEAVAANAGVLTLPMVNLRDACGAGRIGHIVKGRIQEELSRHGLAHYPEDLPASQHRSVRLYLMGSPVQTLIEAVLNPEAGDDAKDELIRRAVSGQEATLLRKIRELLCT